MSKFRIATWNTQGHAFSDQRMTSLVNRFSPDVICLQECGNLSNMKFPIRAWGCHRGYKKIGRFSYDVIYYPWGEDNLRCSLATLLRRGAFAGMHSDDVEISYLPNSEDPPLDIDYCPIIDPDFKGTRPMLRTSVYVDDGILRKKISINNVHLISGNHAGAQKMFKDFVESCTGRYILIGDMNIPSNKIEVPCRSYLHSSRDMTQKSGNVLDFAYTNLSCELTNVDTYFVNSDHLSVGYEITI